VIDIARNQRTKVIVFNLSGHGFLDLASYDKYLAGSWSTTISRHAIENALKDSQTCLNDIRHPRDRWRPDTLRVSGQPVAVRAGNPSNTARRASALSAAPSSIRSPAATYINGAAPTHKPPSAASIMDVLRALVAETAPVRPRSESRRRPSPSGCSLHCQAETGIKLGLSMHKTPQK